MTDTVVNFLNECRHYAGGELTPVLEQRSDAFMEEAEANPAILRAAAESLQTLPYLGAAWVAQLLGIAVDNGADPAETMSAMVQCLRSWLAQLPSPTITQNDDGEEEEDYPDPSDQQTELFDAFEGFAPSLVSHLAAMPTERGKLSQDSPLMGRLTTLSSYSMALGWILEALQRQSGSLIILYPPTGVGLQLKYENIARNFHLFSLLQVAVGKRIPGGKIPNPTITAAARGQIEDDVSDHAWWHYEDPRCKTPELDAMIMGEDLVKEIPVINGSQVMLVWPPIFERSWGAGFFTPHLEAMPENVVVEKELSPDAARKWLKALGLA